MANNQDPQNNRNNSQGTPEKKKWFATNSSGAGMHPQTWQGVVVLVVAVAVVVCIVVLIRKVLL